MRTSSSRKPSGHFPSPAHKLRAAIGGGVSLINQGRRSGWGTFDRQGYDVIEIVNRNELAQEWSEILHSYPTSIYRETTSGSALKRHGPIDCDSLHCTRRT